MNGGDAKENKTKKSIDVAIEKKTKKPINDSKYKKTKKIPIDNADEKNTKKDLVDGANKKELVDSANKKKTVGDMSTSEYFNHNFWLQRPYWVIKNATKIKLDFLKLFV